MAGSAKRIADEPGKFIKFFNYEPAMTERWNAGKESGLEVRDLGVTPASLGDMGARLIRIKGEAPTRVDWSSEDCELRFLYLVSGSATVIGGNRPLRLGPEDAYSVGTGKQLALSDLSSDFVGLDLWLRSGARPALANADEHLAKMSPETFETGNNLRRFFAYRNLGTDKVTDGRVYSQVIKAIDTPKGGTGWHYHSMSQFAFGLTGEAFVDFDGQQAVKLGAMDAVSIPRHCTHNLSSLTTDYSIIEVCLPGKYDTIPIDQPAPRGKAA